MNGLKIILTHDNKIYLARHIPFGIYQIYARFTTYSDKSNHLEWIFYHSTPQMFLNDEKVKQSYSPILEKELKNIFGINEINTEGY